MPQVALIDLVDLFQLRCAARQFLLDNPRDPNKNYILGALQRTNDDVLIFVQKEAKRSEYPSDAGTS